MSISVIIPARYASTRFPGKVLAMLGDQPVLVHVIRAVGRLSQLDRLIVATDHPEVESVARQEGVEVFRSRQLHASGTSRIAEVVYMKGLDDKELVINVQADEPFIRAEDLELLVREHLQYQPMMSTLAAPIRNASDLSSPHLVKVVFDLNQHALYFSRSIIPYGHVGSISSVHWQHIGIYGYTVGALKQYQAWSVSRLEQAEQLEQLRILFNGGSIRVSLLEEAVFKGIDTVEDLEQAFKHLSPCTD